VVTGAPGVFSAGIDTRDPATCERMARIVERDEEPLLEEWIQAAPGPPGEPHR
jgi:hypothetical protein